MQSKDLTYGDSTAWPAVGNLLEVFNYENSWDKLSVTFTSDDSVSGKGFIASYSGNLFAKYKNLCSFEWVLSVVLGPILEQSHGELAYPGYGSYGHLVDIHWTIKVEDGRQVHIEFRVFEASTY